MKPLAHRTKIVATIGPASSSPDVIKQMVQAGMNVARLNFSHGSYDDHARMVTLLRDVEYELDTPITLLQDLQGPKIRVGQLPNGAINLVQGASIALIPLGEFQAQPNAAAIDYPYLAEEARPGMQILLDDGLLELTVQSVEGTTVHCKIVEGGVLKSRKGVNLPSLNLRLPSLTDKDKQDLQFGLAQGVDWVSLSFVRRAADIRALRELLTAKGAPDMPIMAKIEKPQAIDNLDAILDECNGVMVARGDLGVEMRPEKVPLLQKRIIKGCNERSIPVITATQMLESMIHNPRPTRAEASDVANAILDGTDAVMLSGESAVGDHPIKAVEMLARIATDVENELHFDNIAPVKKDEVHALTEAINTIDNILDLQCIAAFTTTGYTATLAAEERLNAPIVAFTPDRKVYHRLNLVWGVKPLLMDYHGESLEPLMHEMETILLDRNLVSDGDEILILGGSPLQRARGTNFIKLHTIGAIKD